MEFAELIQKFFLVLLPGTLGMLLYNKLNIRKEQHDYLEILQLICVSVASYLLADFVFWILNFIPGFPIQPVNILNELGKSEINLPAPNIFAAVLASIFIVCVMTKANAGHWLFFAANFLGVTKRTENLPVWDQFFDNFLTDADDQIGLLVLRDFVTKNTYYGKIWMVSDDSEKREILFENVIVLDEQSRFLYYANFLYLSREHDQFVIEVNPRPKKHEKNDGKTEDVKNG